MKNKRVGYKDPKKQVEANKRYFKNNPEARERVKIIEYKSKCKKYIREYLQLDEIDFFVNLIKERVEYIKQGGIKK